MRLEELSGSEYRTLVLILRYLSTRDRPQACLTYQGLRSWIHYTLPRQERPEWHTVERALRSLAEKGILRRVRKGKRVIFCKTTEFYQLQTQYLHQLRSAELPETSPYRWLLEKHAGGEWRAMG